MIKDMAEYARGSGKINHADVQKILSMVERTVSEGSYLALAPQFVVTADRRLCRRSEKHPPPPDRRVTHGESDPSFRPVPRRA